MKRRSFLGGVLAAIGASFLPRAKISPASVAVTRPQDVAFRPVRFFVSSSSDKDWVINDIRIGNRLL